MIHDLLKEFNIRRSLKGKGSPYDKAVAEAQFKIIKTKFVSFRRFKNIEHLKVELMTYVYWFNNKKFMGCWVTKACRIRAVSPSPSLLANLVWSYFI